jgi:AcrR family transcriptional regulator
MTIENLERNRTTNRQAQILDAALRAFLKFGYDRVAMGEIAAEAGVSRASLYRYFTGKDDIVRALMTHVNGETLEAAAQAAGQPGPFEKRLLDTLDARLGAMLRLLRDSPHRKELTDETHRITGEGIMVADRRYLEIIARVFAADDISLARVGLSPERCANLCFAAAKGLMEADAAKARDEELRDRLRDLVTVWTAALKGG